MEGLPLFDHMSIGVRDLASARVFYDAFFAPLDCADSDLPDYKITDYGIAQLGKKHDKPSFLAVGLHKKRPWQ